jgi:predicted DNA-binding transcriptional regulator YafY
METQSSMMTPTETLVAALVIERRGRNQAVGVAELAGRTGLDDRTVREIVKHLVEEYGLPIGSSPGDPAGYYLIQENSERMQVRNSLLRRAVSILRRAKAYEKAGWVNSLIGQLELQIAANQEEAAS